MSALTRMRTEAIDALAILVDNHSAEFAALLGIDHTDDTDVDVLVLPAAVSKSIAGPTHEIWVTIGDRRLILTADPE